LLRGLQDDGVGIGLQQQARGDQFAGRLLDGLHVFGL
jgi:hypothetical protein